MARVLVGQRELVDGLLVALLCQGHVLVEGVPGLAKTTAVRAFARVLDLDFRRIQFTPDLLPADLLGTQVYEPASGSFRLHRGPLFHNVILADEINRAPAKVQSALLEAMEERQVTLAGETLRLPEPFLVMATQNPVEQEGVYRAARGAGRPLHAQAPRRLSVARRRDRDRAQPHGAGRTSSSPRSRSARSR